MKQTVTISLDNLYFKSAYKFNIQNQHKYKLKIIVDELGYDIGYIKLSVKFIQHKNGLMYCKIFEVYSHKKKRLIYNNPISSLVPWGQRAKNVYIQGYDKEDMNATVETTDSKGNITGTHQFNKSHLGPLGTVIDVYFDNTKEQKKADKLYKNYISKPEEKKQAGGKKQAGRQRKDRENRKNWKNREKPVKPVN